MSKIALNLIDPPAWNSRVEKTGAGKKEDEAAFNALRDSMKEHGQQSPIEVVKKGERYEVVFGDRRRRAALALKWTDIEANVVAEADAARIVTRNITENRIRADLTSYEEARAASHLASLKLPDDKIAAEMGFSRQKASNMRITFDAMPEAIKKDWQNDHPAATVDFLRELAVAKNFPTDEAKVKTWDAKCRELAAEGKTSKGRGKGKGKAKGGSAVTLSVHAYRVLLAHVNNKETADEIGGTKKWLYQVLCYFTGARKTPPDGIVIKEVDPDDLEDADVSNDDE